MKKARALSLAFATMAIVVVAVPLRVIHPFRAQGTRELGVALTLLRVGPIATIVLAIAAVVVTVHVFRTSKRRRDRVLATVCAVLVTLCALVARVNIFEKMFHPLGVPTFIPAAEAKLEPKDVVVALRRGDVARAYPLRAIAYHHIVNDVVSEEALAVTYCSLCHTGVVWSRVVRGRVLTFRIGGINNQNMIMRDEETGTFWQQSTGEALSGPLAGERLRRLPSDELSFSLWRSESPDGVVLAPKAEDEAHYEPADWEAQTDKLPLVVNRDASIPARTLVVGVSFEGTDRAYKTTDVIAGSPLRDQLGSVPIVLVAASDGASIRVFDARQQPVERAWRFDGCEGASKERCLAPLPSLVSYWFDWREHHTETTLFRRSAGGG
jgi:hypothetical protein